MKTLHKSSNAWHEKDNTLFIRSSVVWPLPVVAMAGWWQDSRTHHGWHGWQWQWRSGWSHGWDVGYGRPNTQQDAETKWPGALMAGSAVKQPSAQEAGSSAEGGYRGGGGGGLLRSAMAATTALHVRTKIKPKSASKGRQRQGAKDMLTVEPERRKRSGIQTQSCSIDASSDFLKLVEDQAVWVKSSPWHLEPYLLEGKAQMQLDPTEKPGLTVALCTATKNRLWQLQRALPLNLFHAWPHRNWTTVYLVDCGSTDGTLEWVKDKCRDAMNAGLLKVYTAECQYWHASICKNTAHKVAKEDILVNVDCDNLIGPGFPVIVADQFKLGKTVVQFEGKFSGSAGRIACIKNQFYEIGGYDEDTLPMGFQDIDLLRRLQLLPWANAGRCINEKYVQCIPNGVDSSKSRNEAKLDNVGPTIKAAFVKKRFKNGSWFAMDEKNKQKRSEKTAQGLLKRNVGETSQICCKIGLDCVHVLP